ncbi:orotidine-5'-phosphate decarboxylase [Rothia uropygioeca]|uniref:orotidine-5'-phosphate decarboxylase n=1 Tax=Kocuria sp. 257 TaxID=2021970 RepID=UPI0010126C80|nr:orotidine-5'-phosphate decarboxylase [Kocuria sp. 257]
MTATARPAGDRLYRAMQDKGPLCVGIDPHPALLAAWGLPDDAGGCESFALTVMDAIGGEVASVKPQVALFERHGSDGLRVLERVVAKGRASGTQVICDAKRGDIGSTMAAYADAWLDGTSPLAGDSVTLSPYLGFGSLVPALDVADANRRGTFVLALTSNPEGADVQHRGQEVSVAKSIVAQAEKENRRREAEFAGPCGLVVGATVGPALETLGISLAEFNGLILAPGYGAQGATESDLARVFEGVTDRVVVASSRGVLQYGPDAGSLVGEARRCNDALMAALGH